MVSDEFAMVERDRFATKIGERFADEMSVKTFDRTEWTAYVRKVCKRHETNRGDYSTEHFFIWACIVRGGFGWFNSLNATSRANVLRDYPE